MRKPYKWLLLVFAFALVVAACGGDDEADTTTEAPTATTEAPPATTEAPSETTEAPPATTEAPSETTEAPPAEGGTIIIGTTDTISSLDSSDAYAVRDWEVLKAFGEPLIKYEPGSDAVLIPGIATGLPEASDDGLSYTLTLRDNVMFGDGTQLTADIAAAQLNRLLTISETGPNKVGLTLASPYVESIEAVDELTLQFNLLQPLAFFPQILASAAYIPMLPSQFPEDELTIFPDAPIYGVGAWTVTEFVPGETMTLEPNEFYYGDPPPLEQVIVRHFADPQSMALAVQNGEIDVAWRILGAELAEPLADVEGLNSEVIPSGPIRYLVVNHVLEPTNDPLVRKAIASAIDRDELSDVVFGGAVEPLYSPVPPGFLGANEAFDDLYGSPNVDAARDFLTQAGYSEDNPLVLPLWYPPEHYGATTADGVLLVAEQLEATGMIDVQEQAQEWSTYIGALTGGEEYPVGVLGWFYDFPDAENYTQPFIEFRGLGTMVTDTDNNITPGVNEQLLTLLNESRSITDFDERAAVLEELQNVYADEVVTIPLWLEPEFIVYRDGVCGDSGLDNPQTLNIGPTMEFNYAVLNFC